MNKGLIIDDELISFSEYVAINLPKHQQSLLNVQLFVRNWLNNQEFFTLHTSGSTGKPKTIRLQRAQMQASAEATIQALNLKPATQALLCMSPEMVGGKMMLVRAMVGDWVLHIVPPSSTPIVEAKIDFAAMVPLQVESLLKTEKGFKFLNRIDQLIIGGAPISEALNKSLLNLSTRVYQTFGMTETVSHIALKRLNGKQKSDQYELIGDNEVKLNDRACLSIKGTVTNHEWVHTNDLVELSNKGFRWLGRADWVINSGGIKIQIEALEQQLREQLKTEVVVWKSHHQELGEQVVAIVRNKEKITLAMEKEQQIKEKLPPYHFPKKWLYIPDWKLTASGKIDRKATFELAAEK